MTSEGNMYMPVAPMGNGGDGFFGGNGNGAWWLLILLAIFGWGNGGFGGFGGYGGAGGGFINADVQRGFDQSA